MNQVFKLLRFLKPYRAKAVLALVLLILVVGLDLAIPRLVQSIIDDGVLAGNLAAVRSTFLIMLVISLLDTLFAVGNNNLSIRVGEGVARDLREALFLRIQSFSFGNLDRLKTGQLMVRLSSDTAVIQRLFQVTLRIGTRAPLLMIGSIVLMFRTDRGLALTVLPLLIVTSVVIAVFSVRMGPLFLKMQEKLDRLNTVLQENIAGVRVVKAFVRAAREIGRFGETNEEYAERNIRVLRTMAVMGPLLNLALNAGIAIVVWAGGLSSVQGGPSAGHIVAFINYLQTTVVPLMNLVNLANVWAAAIASAGRVNEVIDTAPDVTDAPDAIELPASGRLRVVFENVSFRYDAATLEPVLRNVDLAVEPGRVTAVLGATGSGKSTLINLVPRFYDASEGRVLIDDADIRRIRQDSLLARIAVVPQETVLFTGTVRDNIRYGKPDAPEDDIVAAARAAHAHEFVSTLPHGYDTLVGERGVNLSGGQKQRIAIARALLTRPSLLILDDSTSSVDTETETKIQGALEEWMATGASGERRGTILVVAQRISTVLKADKIVVLDRGRVAAEGTHRELLQSSPVYRDIYDSQLGDGPDGEAS